MIYLEKNSFRSIYAWQKRNGCLCAPGGVVPRRTALVPMGRQFRRKRGATRRTMLARCFGRTVLPPFSLPFFPLLSRTVSPMFPFPFFPLRPSCSYLLLLLPPSILFSLQRFSISFRYSYAVSLSPSSFPLVFQLLLVLSLSVSLRGLPFLFV